MRALRFAVAAIGVGLLLAIGTIWATVETSPTAKTLVSEQPEKFDHSQCQYPDRTTNPAHGCDNSDPCDPASAAKGGSGECTETNAPAVVTEPIIEMEGK